MPSLRTWIQTLQAIIKLLGKGDKDLTALGNFRPILLLSVLYKMASCSITNRLRECLIHIIGRDQKVYVDNDNIGSVLINIMALINDIIQKKDPALLLLIHLKYTFDSIDHGYINSVLKAFNFSSELCQWIELFFLDRVVSVLMSGHLTPSASCPSGGHFQSIACITHWLTV